MSNLLSILVAASAAGSVVVGLMLLLRPVTARIFSARWQYRIGKMAIAFFLIPVSLLVGRLTLPQPAVQNHYLEPAVIQKAIQPNGFVGAMDALMEKHLPLEVIEAILFIWLLGAIVYAAWHVYVYRRFSRELRAHNIPIPEDAETFTLLSACKTTLGIRGQVKLMHNGKVPSPMLVGLLRPVILLPTSNLRAMDLKLVLTHELTHLKGKDLWVKILALAAATLHWFNPLVHVLRKDVSTWSELSCDEAVASEMSYEERKRYGEAVLNTLDMRADMATAFCSSLCGSRKYLKRRLIRMLNVKKAKKHILVLAVATILAIGSLGTAAAVYAASNAPKPTGERHTPPPRAETQKMDKEQSLKWEKEFQELKARGLVDNINIPPVQEAAQTNLSETLATKLDTANITSKKAVLLSVKLSDEHHFTSEEWKSILAKIESGEIKLEAEGNAAIQP